MVKLCQYSQCLISIPGPPSVGDYCSSMLQLCSIAFLLVYANLSSLPIPGRILHDKTLPLTLASVSFRRMVAVVSAHDLAHPALTIYVNISNCQPMNFLNGRPPNLAAASVMLFIEINALRNTLFQILTIYRFQPDSDAVLITITMCSGIPQLLIHGFLIRKKEEFSICYYLV